jgi:solute carrier family 25 carnitine/acylcarnitine transporter 20/29
MEGLSFNTDPYTRVLACFAARGGSILVGQPFDVIKTRLQNSNSKRGAVSMAIRMVTAEGPFVLWKGTPQTFVASVPLTLSFSYYDAFKRYLASEFDISANSQKFFSGSLTGATNTCLTCSIERIRVLQQVTKGTTTVSLRSVFNQVGFTGLYKGFTPYFLREVIGCGFYFSVYDMALSNQDNGSLKLMLAGALAGVSFWSVIYPFDCIKTRMQADDLTSPKYSSSFDCLKKTVKNEGYLALTRGYFQVILRTIPANAVFITLYGTFLAFSR